MSDDHKYYCFGDVTHDIMEHVIPVGGITLLHNSSLRLKGGGGTAFIQKKAKCPVVFGILINEMPA